MNSVLSERVFVAVFKNQDPTVHYCGGKVVLIHWRVTESTDANHVIKRKK